MDGWSGWHHQSDEVPLYPTEVDNEVLCPAWMDNRLEWDI